STSQTVFPSAASRHSARRDSPLFPPVFCTAVVRKTRPPASTGDDHPRPGTATFHATFSVALHRTGTPVASEWPCPSGPRNCGQSPAAPIEPSHRATAQQQASLVLIPIAQP